MKVDFDVNTPIRQYMPLKYLLELLESGMYHVNRRYSFKDTQERTHPIKDIFSFHIAGDNAPKPSAEYLKNELRKLQERTRRYKQLGNLPTSCWTYSSFECALMWERYGHEPAVCISSSLSRIHEAIVLDDREMCFGLMEYRYNYHGLSPEDFLLVKSKEFESEREVRIYFPLKDTAVEDVVDSEGQLIKLPAVKFQCDTHKLISGVKLSPLIDKISGRAIQDYLSNKYGIRVSRSSICYSY